MSLLWNNSYSVGIEEIDNQHKHLISLINTLQKFILQGEARDKVGEIINEMIEYSNYHFKTEEELFRKFSYPQAEAHVLSHHYFSSKVLSFKEDYQSSKGGLSMDVMHFLRNWLIQHISGEDKAYASFFQNVME